MKYKNLIIITLIFCIIFFTCSCQKKVEEYASQKRLKVVTTLFPLYDFSKNIAKEKAEVSLLLPPGIEAHSFEPKPGDIINIRKADIFIYTGRYMEPWVEDILGGIDNKNLLIIDASKNIFTATRKKNNYVNIDPHIWLDFSFAQKIVDEILKGFAEKDPANVSYYLKNAEDYKIQLKNLDVEYKESLSTCKKDFLIHGGHFAFGYLVKRYNLKYLSAYGGFSPDAEPTPQNLIELIEKMKTYKIKYVFYEELINPKIAKIIAEDTGAKLLKLHGAHNVSEDEFKSGVSFISLMKKNLDNLRIGLECK